MEYLILVVVGFLLLVPPFVIGYEIESRLTGLIVLCLVPVLVSIFGIAAYLNAESSPEKETRDWSFIALALPMAAIGALSIGLIAWGIGRARARRNHERVQATEGLDQSVS